MGRVLYSLSNDTVKLEVYEDVVVITRKGLWSYLEGTRGGRRIPIDTIGYIKLGKPGVFSDTVLEFGVPGSDKNSTFENTFPYDAQDYRIAEEIKDFIERKIIERGKEKRVTSYNQLSIADEIRKYKELFDMGAITEEEFNVAKKKLLNKWDIGWSLKGDKFLWEIRRL